MVRDLLLVHGICNQHDELWSISGPCDPLVAMPGRGGGGHASIIAQCTYESNMPVACGRWRLGMQRGCAWGCGLSLQEACRWSVSGVNAGGRWRGCLLAIVTCSQSLVSLFGSCRDPRPELFMRISHTDPCCMHGPTLLLF